MDFKSLKRQRDGKAKRGDVKAKAAALRQAKLEAEAAARRDAEKARAKREAMTMPPPPPRATAAKPKATKKVARRRFVAYGSDDDDDGGGDAAAPAAPAAAPAAAAASAEDDATAAAAAGGRAPGRLLRQRRRDLRARGIDPEKKKAKDESAAWAEFQEFAGGVREQEAHDEAAEATEADDEYEGRISTRPGNIIIPDPKELEKKLPTYFRHEHYSSFQRQLNNFGYNKLHKSSSPQNSVHARIKGDQLTDMDPVELLQLRPVLERSTLRRAKRTRRKGDKKAKKAAKKDAAPTPVRVSPTSPLTPPTAEAASESKPQCPGAPPRPRPGPDGHWRANLEDDDVHIFPDDFSDIFPPEEPFLL
ncbi:hypothetical protein SO694_00121088 [Aureococcus anophagefferens]|uniref:HSF-type DNA-binding domain-containing protein n=1 Tax=Aureococcus anophagefferens TaxID=44056 RepID=A0ABR1G369_AURAN